MVETSYDVQRSLVHKIRGMVAEGLLQILKGHILQQGRMSVNKVSPFFLVNLPILFRICFGKRLHQTLWSTDLKWKNKTMRFLWIMIQSMQTKLIFMIVNRVCVILPFTIQPQPPLPPHTHKHTKRTNKRNSMPSVWTEAAL